MSDVVFSSCLGESNILMFCHFSSFQSVRRTDIWLTKGSREVQKWWVLACTVGWHDPDPQQDSRNSLIFACPIRETFGSARESKLRTTGLIIIHLLYPYHLEVFLEAPPKPKLILGIHGQAQKRKPPPLANKKRVKWTRPMAISSRLQYAQW